MIRYNNNGPFPAFNVSALDRMKKKLDAMRDEKNILVPYPGPVMRQKTKRKKS